MAISNLTPASTIDNWVEIATNTSTAGTKSFTSVPTTYRKLMLRWHSIAPDTNTVDLFIRLNGISTANTYVSSYIPFRSSVVDPSFANNGFMLDNSTTTTNLYLGYIVIDSASTTNSKIITGINAISTGDTEGGFVDGLFVATAAISQVDLLVTSGTISGTATLYGAA
jgi:hypothetical protein